ncbi:Cocaine esterase-like protein [Spiribacter salinus M19-40]|uniref:Cocaine esterase-like protein n=1 Tax=Spiribacter salinus M19-40 TaxID=1260251 RepID=R4VK29_9GAMM|nr:CocE/NonD family hydrolase [Spiribacter salinus]AGM40872.1 Cocaine esterase-like protein [Spiribacter salinus M19-40]
MTVSIHEDVRIPMADGITLSARIWHPPDAGEHPVPAILEYIPYRKRDFTRARDETLHRCYAEHGYAGVRVDLRGSGESEGLLTDEYIQQELDDGYAVVEWLAEQPWCDGNVGMIGISWGGFNGLQIAAMQPPALKAIVTVCSTDDRYADDVHYMGGCLLGDNLSWASVMFAYNSLPPDPALRGEDWRQLWHQRLEANAPWLIKWLEHPARDDYWRHGSICEDHAAVQCPVMAVSGWADGYTDAVFRLLEQLSVPRQGLVGPWSHKYPHQGVPGPAIGFQQETLRWWDRWLKGRETGIMQEPMLRAWVQEATEPATRYHHRPGHWVGERAWPSPYVQPQMLYPATGGHLRDTPMAAGDDQFILQSPLSLGLFAGKWCSYSAGPDLPYDQREEDGGALVFETDPLDAPMELLGAPELTLRCRVDRPVAQVAARLSDVAVDGKATRITYGVLNLNHREGHHAPEALTPGEAFTVVLKLNDLGHRLTPGHRLRLSLSTSYWPLAVPPPEPVCMKVLAAGTTLSLPVRAVRDDAPAVHFPEPAYPDPVTRTPQKLAEHRWVVHRDLETSASALEVIKDEGRYRIEDVDLLVEDATYETYRSVGEDFSSIEGEVIAWRAFERDDWAVSTRTRTRLEADDQAFHVHAELDAWEAGRRVFSRNWHERIPRRFV